MGHHRARAARTGLEAGPGRAPGTAPPAIPTTWSGGHRWQTMPADFPHWRGVYEALFQVGATEAMHDALRRACACMSLRLRLSALDQLRPPRPREEAAGDVSKKVQGRKRHIAVDVTGLLLTVLVTAASVQDLAWITRHRRTVRDYERLTAPQRPSSTGPIITMSAAWPGAPGHASGAVTPNQSKGSLTSPASKGTLTSCETGSGSSGLAGRLTRRRRWAYPARR